MSEVAAVVVVFVLLLLCFHCSLCASPSTGVPGPGPPPPWAVINSRMHAIPLRIPRTVYVDAAAPPGSRGGEDGLRARQLPAGACNCSNA